VNYPPTSRGLPISQGIASSKTEVLPGCLTFPPLAVSLVPKDKIRKPSFLILVAAFTSLSCWVLHPEQVQFLVSKLRLSTLFRQTLQVLLEGNHLSK
jgi:hypothetical protein